MMTRLEILANSLPDDIDAGLITSGINRRYYTGFASSAGVLLVTREKSWFFIDFRYYEHAKEKITDCEVVLQKNLAEQINRIFLEKGLWKLAVETEQMTLAEFRSYQEKLEDASLVQDDRFQKLILKQRIVKTEKEIGFVLQAQEIAERAFEETLNYISVGKTEREIALYLDDRMRRSGAEALSFDTIVASGKNSAVPHAVPTDKPVESGDFIVIDFGAVINGYHSDMTRTIAVGAISAEQERIYDVVLRAQLAALARVSAGVSCAEIDAAARDIIAESGYAECFGHSTGHGIGLEIHEAPGISPKSGDVAAAGMLFSIEPGIYLAGKFGVRTEDMVVVTPDGCKNLTKTKKDRISL